MKTEMRMTRMTGHLDSHRLEGGGPSDARQERQASSVQPTFGGPTERKSPVRRCFKSPDPPLNGVRRFASGCRFFLKGG